MTNIREQVRAWTTSHRLIVEEENEVSLEETNDDIEGGYNEWEDANLNGDDETNNYDLEL